MRHVFIINPISGKKDAAQGLLPGIKTAVAGCGVSAEYHTTEAPRHAAHLAEECAKSGQPVRLYAVGGDGTLNEVLRGALPYAGAEVACVPCGSGNDFVRAFGDKAPFLDIRAQINGTAMPIDLMEVDGGICAAITSTGLDAEVAYNIPKYRRIPLLGGSMAYNISIVEKLLKPLGKQLSITIDGREQRGRFLIAAVCNARHYGGGYNAAPYATLDDGMLDVILVKKISRLLIASIIGKYKKGIHLQQGAVAPALQKYMTYVRAREVLIQPLGTEPFILNVDGECGPAPRLYARVLPGAARFVLPVGVSAPASAF